MSQEHIIDTPRMADTEETRPTSSQADDVVKEPASRRARLRRHCIRFWWLYLLLLIAIVLCIVLPIIYVYYPKKAQSEVNASTIIATYQSITNASPTSFHYNQSALLEISTSYTPELYSWNGSYYLEGSDTPFLSITIPQITARNGTDIQTQQNVEIYNMDEFVKNNDLIFSAANFSIYLRGNGGLQQSGLPNINVNYDKKIDLVGLNKLQGLEVTEFHILSSLLPDGANAAGNVSIPNPSIFSLQMGNVTLDLSVNGTSIGNATLPDFTLSPGTNEYLLHVTSNQSRVLDLLKEPAYRCGILPISIQGKQSIVNGQEIPYFSAPLQANLLSTKLDIGPAFREIGLGGLINGTCETS